MAQTKVLLSTPWGPYEPDMYYGDQTDVMSQRFSRGCDIFTLTGHMHMNGPHLVAQNIRPPTVYLEYPRRDDFLRELRRGYDVVGLSLLHNRVEDAIEMCRVIREVSPDATVVLGGYGAVGIEAVYPPKEWRVFADHICHGEGIAFMRRLLGEPEDGPIQVTHLPHCSMTLPWLNKHAAGNVGVIVGSLGCPKGCDFCGTTQMYSKRRIEILSPAQVVTEMKRLYTEHPGLLTVIILEEDSFAQKEYLSEIGRLIREDQEVGGLAVMSYYMLGGIESMSEWTYDEIMRTGCLAAFIGVESKFAPEHGYKKRGGLDLEEAFWELHRRGISSTGAWMAGFDFQTPQNIEEDLRSFVSLQPTFQQLTRVCAFPATALWRELCARGKLDPSKTEWDKATFFGGGGMQPANFSEHEITEIVDRGYRLLYETWGSSLARRFEVDLNGYEYCREHPDLHLRRDRSRLHKRNAAQVYPALRAMEVYAPNGQVRARMRRSRQRYHRLVGPPTRGQQVLERLILGLARVEKTRNAVWPRDAELKVEPVKRYDYDRTAAPGRCPYKLTYPRLDAGYTAYNAVVSPLSTALRHSVVGLDRLVGRLGGPFDEDIADGLTRGPF